MRSCNAQIFVLWGTSTLEPQIYLVVCWKTFVWKMILSFVIMHYHPKLTSTLAELSKKANRNATQWCHYRSAFLFHGEESETTQKLFVSLPNNLPQLWKVLISLEDRKTRQNRVLYAENRNRMGVTYIGVQKSLA